MFSFIFYSSMVRANNIHLCSIPPFAVSALTRKMWLVSFETDKEKSPQDQRGGTDERKLGNAVRD